MVKKSIGFVPRLTKEVEIANSRPRSRNRSSNTIKFAQELSFAMVIAGAVDICESKGQIRSCRREDGGEREAPCEEREREKLLESQAVTNSPEAPTEGRKRKD